MALAEDAKSPAIALTGLNWKEMGDCQGDLNMLGPFELDVGNQRSLLHPLQLRHVWTTRLQKLKMGLFCTPKTTPERAKIWAMWILIASQFIF